MLFVTNYIVWSIVLVIKNEISALSYNQPKLCSNATWNKNGITFVNNSILDGDVHGFFIDYKDNIYVSIQQKSQLLKWSKESTSPSSIISVNLPEYPVLFVINNGDIYFTHGDQIGRIDKLTINSTTSKRVANFTDNCFGLFIDNNNILYCSVLYKHRVIKKSLTEENSTPIIVAGTGSPGAASDELQYPWGIFVDNNFNLYVADSKNNRIQFFCPEHKKATTVAGNRIPQNLLLNTPTDVVLDADNYLYIADDLNNRIIRSGRDDWQCIIGCSNKKGSAPNELYNAYSIRFDSHGNIYVADEHNHRIQKFILAINACDQQETSTFLPITYSIEDGFGPYRNISNALCDILNPCQHGGTCYNKEKPIKQYFCLCPPGFTGRHCEIDNRPCKPTTCWNNGTCENTSDTSFICNCASGWEGDHCERKINYCRNITCENGGVCRPLFLDYKCECVGDNYYSGRHCEIKSRKILILKTISKTSASIAIIVLITAIMFIVCMDLLKYCFGIDPACEDLAAIRRKELAKKRKPVIQRFIYVHASPSSEQPKSKVEETVV